MRTRRVDTPLNVTAGQVMDGKTLRHWQTAPSHVDPINQAPEGGATYNGFFRPWEALSVSSTGPFSRYWVLSKNGDVVGYEALLAFQPESKLGIFATLAHGARWLREHEICF